MRDNTKTKSNDIKIKAVKPTKLQLQRAEAIEEARKNAKAQEEERQKANATFKEHVRQAEIESGNRKETDDSENDEWDNKADSKEVRDAERLARRASRMAKKGHL